MYIEEPATYQQEAQYSAQNPSTFSSQPNLEVCQHSLSALQIALAASGLELWDWDLVNRDTYYTALWQKILGYEFEEIKNDYQSFEKLVHPQDLPKVHQVLNDYLTGCIPVFAVELRMLTKSSEWKWVLTCGQISLWDEFGKPVRITGTHRDITLQKSLEETLQQCRQREQLLLGQLQQEIVNRELIEQQHHIISTELQYTQKQLLQNETMANLGKIVGDMANEINNPVSFIYENLRPASEYAEELITLIELYQRYYPTPMPVIGSYLQNFDFNFIKTDFLKLLWSMRAGSERIQEIIFALKNFSGFDESQKKKANIHEGIDSVLRILHHRLKSQPERLGIDVIKDFGNLPLVECYPSQLNQVFMNILNNAIDALEERMKQDYNFIPKIWIRTEIISSHLSLVSHHENQKNEPLSGNRGKILIHIYDNGKGILPHIQRHIFEPFFTTKPIDKAKGLGLSISQKIIVEKHQGQLKCHSQLGKGTEFIIEMNTAKKHYTNMRKHASF
jgi:PAS domain S-box-containing protein